MPVSVARKQVKSSKLPWGLTCWKDFFAPRSIWNTRESTRLCKSIEHQLEDSWQVSMISTSDSCNIQSQVRRPSSHEGAGPQIPTAHWTPKIYHWRTICVWSKKLCKVVQTTLKTHLMKGLFWTVEQWKGTREHETVQKHWTSIGGFLASFNDLNRWFLQHPKSGKKAFISWRSTSSNTHCALNSLDLSLKNREKWRNKSQCPRNPFLTSSNDQSTAQVRIVNTPSVDLGEKYYMLVFLLGKTSKPDLLGSQAIWLKPLKGTIFWEALK